MGGEGLIFRRLKLMYIFDKSYDMLKVKLWIYREVIVVGYNEGIGKYKNKVGLLIVEYKGDLDIEDDEIVICKGLFNVGFGLNDW